MPAIIVKGDYQNKAIRFLPPNTTNLLYWGMYGKDVAFTSKNHMNGGIITAIGTPIYPDNNHATFKGGNNYLKTSAVQTPNMTFISVFKIDTEVGFNLISNYTSTGQAGSPSSVRGAGIELQVGTASDGKLNVVANRSVNVSGTDTSAGAVLSASYTVGQWCAIASTINSTTGVCKVYNLTTGTSGQITNANPVSLGSAGFYIGSAITAPSTNDGNMAFSAIYSDAKTDAEINEIYAAMKQYYAKRGITI